MGIGGYIGHLDLTYFYDIVRPNYSDNKRDHMTMTRDILS